MEILHFGIETRIIDKNAQSGRRYSAKRKPATLRMVMILLAELVADCQTAKRVASSRHAEGLSSKLNSEVSKKRGEFKDG